MSPDWKKPNEFIDKEEYCPNCGMFLCENSNYGTLTTDFQKDKHPKIQNICTQATCPNCGASVLNWYHPDYIHTEECKNNSQTLYKTYFKYALTSSLVGLGTKTYTFVNDSWGLLNDTNPNTKQDVPDDSSSYNDEEDGDYNNSFSKNLEDEELQQYYEESQQPESLLKRALSYFPDISGKAILIFTIVSILIGSVGYFATCTKRKDIYDNLNLNGRTYGYNETFNTYHWYPLEITKTGYLDVDIDSTDEIHARCCLFIVPQEDKDNILYTRWTSLTSYSKRAVLKPGKYYIMICPNCFFDFTTVQYYFDTKFTPFDNNKENDKKNNTTPQVIKKGQQIHGSISEGDVDIYKFTNADNIKFVFTGNVTIGKLTNKMAIFDGKEIFNENTDKFISVEISNNENFENSLKDEYIGADFETYISAENDTAYVKITGLKNCNIDTYVITLQDKN